MKENINLKSDAFNLYVHKVLIACLERIWLIILLCVIGAGAALGYTYRFIPATYQARTSIIVSNTNSVKYFLDASGNLTNTERLVQTYINILRSDLDLEQVQEALGGRFSLGQIKSMVSATQVSNSEMFIVTVTHTDPQTAADVANIASETAIDASMELIRGTNANILDMAKVPQSRSGPDYRKNALIGAACGTALAVGIIALMVFLDVRIKDEEDLSVMFEYPVLGRVPEFANVKQGGKGYGYKYEKNGKTVKGYGYKYEKDEDAGRKKAAEKKKSADAPGNAPAEKDDAEGQK